MTTHEANDNVMTIDTMSESRVTREIRIGYTGSAKRYPTPGSE